VSGAGPLALYLVGDFNEVGVTRAQWAALDEVMDYLAMKWGKADLDQGGESPSQLFQRVEWVSICGTGPWGARREEGEPREYRRRSERYAERGARGDSLANVRSICEVKART
jgi:hypothetical protein